jgi:hypothetical protein
VSQSASTNLRRPRGIRTVGALAAVVLAGGVAAAYQLGIRGHGDPSFRQGGEFLSADDDIPTPGVDGTPYPYGDVTAPSTTAAPAPEVPMSTASAAPAPTPTTRPAATPAAGAGGPATTALPATPVPPATGVYTYAVQGTEGATAFGSRSYPSTATVVVHHDPSVRQDELVHDLRLSDQHGEREIIRYTPQGVAFSFEGGSITFGPGTQTSQATYSPLMVQVPFPLRAGAAAAGSSAAKSGTTVQRTEDWTAKVVGQEVLDVLGQPRTTWVIDVQRRTPPGGAEQVDRFRRYWYDPALGTWVRWTERFHASRDMIVDFTYDTTYTATLTGFRPA